MVGSNGNFINDDQSGFNAIAQLYYDQQLIDNVLSLRFKMDANATFSNVEPSGAFRNLMHNPATLNPYFPTYPPKPPRCSAGESRPVRHRVPGWYDGTTAAYDPATGRSGSTRAPAVRPPSSTTTGTGS